MSGRRRFLRWWVVATLLLGVAAATLPWWFPATIAAVSGRWGVRIGDWSSRGWSGMSLRDVVIEQPGWSMTLAEVSLPVLGLWPRGRDSAGSPRVQARDVVIAVNDRGAVHPEERPQPSVHAILMTTLDVWSEVEKRLRAARVDGLRIFSGEKEELRIHSAVWSENALEVSGVAPVLQQDVSLQIQRRDRETLTISAALPERRAGASATVTMSDDAVALAAALTWREIRGELTARFDSAGLLPREAALDVPSIEMAAADVGISGYGPIGGSLRARWSGEAFSLETKLAAAPDPADGVLPPLEVDVRGSGDVKQLRLEVAHVTAPGVRLDLSEPLTWRFAEAGPDGPVRFTVAVDLALLPWIEGTGRITGSATTLRAGTGDSAVDFELTAKDVRWDRFPIAALDVAGNWAQPRLEIRRAALRLGETSKIDMAGAVDFAQHRLEAFRMQAHLDPAAVRPFWAEVPAFAALDMEAAGEGDWLRPAHRGKVRLDGLSGAPGGPLAADFEWTGDGLVETDWVGRIVSGAGVELPVTANVKRESGGDLDIGVNRLEWRDAEGSWLELAQPARVRVRDPATGGPASRPLIEVSGLRLHGGATRLELDGSLRWPVEGAVRCEVAGFPAARLRTLAPEALHPVVVESLALQAAWADGPARLEGAARMRYEGDGTEGYAAHVGFRSGDDIARGLAVDVNVLAESGVVFEGRGSLPLFIEGRPEQFSISWPGDGAIDLELTSQPNEAFWRSIAALTGWSVSDPQLVASFSGSLAAPRGRIAFTAGELSPPRREAGRTELPRLTGVALNAIADENGVAVDEAVVAVDDRWVRLQARAPWAAWRAWRDGRRDAWREVSFQLASNPMPVSIASHVFPTVLAPDGEVSLDFRHTPSDGLAGHVWLHGAALRPVASVGAIRDINAGLKLHEYEIELEDLSALIGGRPVTINGRGRVIPGERLDFDLRARATRVPIVRDAGLVLRAGLDLRLVRDSAAPARISGQLDLGPSVFVFDLTSLLPTGGVESPEQRPPFFSVREPPFAEWTLDVAVRGNEFLRVVNPLFRGTLSADFRLEGTLGEPRAIGRVTSRDGSVAFPFARVPLQQLEVALSPEAPYTPAILASGATRVFGYDVRMEATGTADEPRLLFAADPPLSSQAVFLMLTTGALPEQSQAFTSGERAQRLALFLGRNLAAGLGIGADAAEDRLTIRSGESFTREGRETLHVQYDLDGRWSIVGEYDRFDAYNGGIKFRLLDR